ncbi:hypothetical protein BRC85_09920 [Halobacteriales archaeon QS_1_69_70]|nr:MAG: hypothetical protein BRC85_09920 [Halobacteriales archaeon QS_1_69_70]
MTLHALDVLGAAVRATREYRPRGLGQWLWVSAVALFVGGTGIGLPTGGGTPGGTGGDLPPADGQELGGGLPGEVLGAILLVVAVVVVLWLLVVVLGALLEAPFLAWLRDGEVATWATARDHLAQGLGLAVFRIAVKGLSLALLAGILVATVGTAGQPLEYLLAAAESAVLLAVVGLPLGVVAAFTTAFVVPTMLLEDAGVVGGWRRFWGTLTDAPKQFAVYAVAVIVLAAVGGFAVILAALVALIVPGLVVGGLLGLVAAVAVRPLAGIVVAATVAAAAFTAVALAGSALLQVFLRYYALFVLARVDGDLDFLPERRRAVGAGLPSDAGDSGPADVDADVDDTPGADPAPDDSRVGPASTARRRNATR